MKYIVENNQILDDIFNKALSGPILFKNKSLLFPQYTPENILFRNEQIIRLGYLCSSLLKGQKSSNLFIYGKPGTGKTAVTKLVLSKLKEKGKEVNSDLYISNINCRSAGTEYRVTAALARDINIDIPFTGLASKEVFTRFEKKLLKDKIPFLIVLDEIDALISRYGDDLLYGLTRINEKDPEIQLMIIGISNDVRFKEYMDPRVLSSLGEEEMIFKPYTPKELENILYDRIKSAFIPNSISSATVSLCAAISGSEHGDARKALDLLRVAGETAEREGRIQVSTQDIKNSQGLIDQNRIVEIIRSLPAHSKMVLTSILKHPPTTSRLKTMHIYALYTQYADEYLGWHLTARRFSSLVHELSILGLIDRKIENFGRKGGRVTTILLESPEKNIRKVLCEEEIFEDIFNI